MNCIWTALVTMALASPATADECKIVWWDLFLPQSEVGFEMTSKVSALLTLKNTSKLAPISFELALRNLTRDNGKKLDVLLGEQTLVAAGLSNHVTVSLQPKTTYWIVGFDSEQTVRLKDGRTSGGEVILTGYLVCNQIKPSP